MRPTRRRVVALAFAALVAAAGCGERSSMLPFEPIVLAPDTKAPRDERFLLWGQRVEIGGLPRFALSSAKPVMPPAEITASPAGQRRVSVEIPAEYAGVPWAVYELVTLVDGAVTPVRVWPITGRQAKTTYGVGVTEARVGPGGTPGVRLWPIPDLAARDVDTAELRVPAGAALQVGLGLEPASWDTTIVPVDMTVSSVEGGTATVLRTTRLDVHRPENRQWVETTIPLDRLAGRTVRFRFSARPSVGPSAVPSLPVWAEPRIVDARRVPS
jgi:hypothetical protein